MAKGLNIYTGVKRAPVAARWMLNKRQGRGLVPGRIVHLWKGLARTRGV